MSASADSDTTAISTAPERVKYVPSNDVWIIDAHIQRWFDKRKAIMHIYNIYKDASYLQLTRHASTIPWNSNEIINPPTPELYRKVVKAFKDALKSSDDYQFCGLYGYKDFYVLLGHCWKMDVARQVTN